MYLYIIDTQYKYIYIYHLCNNSPYIDTHVYITSFFRAFVATVQRHVQSVISNLLMVHSVRIHTRPTPPTPTTKPVPAPHTGLLYYRRPAPDLLLLSSSAISILHANATLFQIHYLTKLLAKWVHLNSPRPPIAKSTNHTPALLLVGKMHPGSSSSSRLLTHGYGGCGR